MNKYNQDKHTQNTITKVKKLIYSGQVTEAFELFSKEVVVCEKNTSKEAARAFVSDILFAVRMNTK